MTEDLHRYGLSERAWTASSQQLLELAKQVDTAHKLVHTTYAQRDDSPAARDAWVQATASLRDALNLMYGGYPFDDRILDIRRADTAAVETAIRFLETDPQCFGAGYVKGRLIRALKAVPLAPSQVTRLTNALMRAIDDEIDRGELKEWRRLASKLDRDLLRQLLAKRLHGDGGRHRRALWVASSIGQYEWVLAHAGDAIRPLPRRPDIQ